MTPSINPDRNDAGKATADSTSYLPNEVDSTPLATDILLASHVANKRCSVETRALRQVSRHNWAVLLGANPPTLTEKYLADDIGSQRLPKQKRAVDDVSLYGLVNNRSSCGDDDKGADY